MIKATELELQLHRPEGEEIHIFLTDYQGNKPAYVLIPRASLEEMLESLGPRPRARPNVEI